MKAVSFIASCALAINQAQAQTQDSCLALALNGGGAKGAYQAGAIYSFNHDGNPEDFEWDVVTGISGGALNTGALAVWDKKDGLAMSEWLSTTWNDLRTHDVWKWWPGGIVQGFHEQSMVDDSPLLPYLQSILSPFQEGVIRKTVVGTVDANTAHYQTWFLDEIPLEDQYEMFPRAVISSASLPGLFQPQKYNGAVYIDGGTAMGLDAMTAVERCLDMVGGDETKVTIDIILLDRFVAPADADVDGDTLWNLERQYSLKSYFKGLENVITTMLAHPNVNYRYILEPSGHYPKLFRLLDFGPKNTWPLQEMGMSDAKAAMEAGPGAHFQKYHEWIASRPDHKQSIEDFVKEQIKN